MATTSRPALLVLRGTVPAPVDAVADVLFDTGPGGRSPVRAGEPGVTVTADPAAHMLAVQGGWWYRAEITLEPDPDGCLVTQRILDVADRLRWGVRFVARKPLARAPAAFEDLLRQLRAACR